MLRYRLASIRVRYIWITDLPIPIRIIEAHFESSELLFRTNVEIELNNVCAGLNEQPFELANAIIALWPDRLRHDIVHPCDDYILVVGAVENHNLALSRRMIVGAPKEVVGELFICGLFEAGYIDPLRMTPPLTIQAAMLGWPPRLGFGGGAAGAEEEEEMRPVPLAPQVRYFFISNPRVCM
jgi:hypothetical protein